MTEQQIAAMVDSMCMTWRHDFGLDKPKADANGKEWPFGFSSGMNDVERNALRSQMRQLVNHHFLPALEAARTSQPAPEGWVLVPVKPTPEMIKAAQFHTEHDDDEERGDPKNYRAIGQALAVWHEMISATPAGKNGGEG